MSRPQASSSSSDKRSFKKLKLAKPAQESEPDPNVLSVERKFQLLNGISDSFYRWSNLSLSLTAVAILINLDLHYIPGGILISIAIVMFAVSFGLSVAEQRYLDNMDLEGLYKSKVVGLWLLRAAFLLQLPFFFWAMVLMFERANPSSVSCPTICP